MTVVAWLQLVQKPSSAELSAATQLAADDSSLMLPDDAATAADSMAEAHGWTDPRDSDTAAAMEGVEGNESHGQHGASASAATAGHKVSNQEHEQSER